MSTNEDKTVLTDDKQEKCDQKTAEDDEELSALLDSKYWF